MNASPTPSGKIRRVAMELTARAESGLAYCTARFDTGFASAGTSEAAWFSVARVLPERIALLHQYRVRPGSAHVG